MKNKGLLVIIVFFFLWYFYAPTTSNGFIALIMGSFFAGAFVMDITYQKGINKVEN